VAPIDPSGLLAGLNLPASQLAAYNGWSFPILASKWANWKPTHKPPYKVAVIENTTNGTNSAIFNTTVALLKKSPLVGSVTQVAVTNESDVPGQLQQYETAVQQHPDLIIFQPIAPPAAVAPIAAAGKMGIPTISVFNDTTTPYAVSIAANPYVAGAETAAGVAQALGGKGSILQVLGVPTAATTIFEQKAWESVFKSCPGIHLAGQTYGFFSTAPAKGATIQWLATHPAGVDGAIESGAMAGGILQAFQQSGRPVPVIGQIGAVQSVASYWLQHESSGYKWAATLAGATQLATQTAVVATRMLAGQGPKINFIPWLFEPLSAAAVKPYINPSWATTDDLAMELPQQYWWTKQDYDRLFNHPELTNGTTS
jgi:ribose transport system substrate-binding protein